MNSMDLIMFPIIAVLAIIAAVVIPLIFFRSSVKKGVEPSEKKTFGSLTLDPTESAAFSDVKVDGDKLLLYPRETLLSCEFTVIAFTGTVATDKGLGYSKKKAYDFNYDSSKNKANCLEINLPADCRGVRVVVTKLNKETIRKALVKRGASLKSCIIIGAVVAVCAMLMIACWVLDMQNELLVLYSRYGWYNKTGGVIYYCYIDDSCFVFCLAGLVAGAIAFVTTYLFSNKRIGK